ncbi:lipid II:glycine glycyltransferase FemX [Thermus thermamylovorans]|uniref:Peptidoglycan bridge formation glycyltransferase FemA/FemB family protein n=1 Tax=Thermus thermamylovorans TaxID=2509362 RepID=A0A4Q9AYH8_9DEIN|nr:peptidoglycan bridge formation glycyltransferase FemA/FemB family protein [Thermus thermamylovorans]TBH16506.1 peptidoglycan bridge formation glycyltransferase FemA/FemB family protein [Thermus thermamylovorans]
MAEPLEVTEPEAWNRLVSGLPITSPLQSWGWGEVKRLSGWTPRRLAVHGEGGLLGAAQVLLRPLPGGWRLAYAPRGPALGRLGDLPAVARALARGLGATHLLLEPEAGLGAEEPLPAFPGLLPEEPIQPAYTLWLDLTQGEEALLRGMKEMHRRNARLALKRTELSVEGEEAFPEFFRLFQETNRRARLLQHSEDYYRAVLRAMNQPLGEAFLALARKEGEALAAGLFVGFAGKVAYLYGGSSRTHPEAKAPMGMHLAAIRHAMAKGYRVYDLWGVPQNPEGSHAEGIWRFKEGFGGRRVRFPAYALPLSPLYRPLQILLRLRKTWTNLRVRGSPRDVLG